MTDRKVIPFRKRPPSEAELEVYRQITRTGIRKCAVDAPSTSRPPGEEQPAPAATRCRPELLNAAPPSISSAALVEIFSIASPTVKLAGLARGGNP
jgi:hypothetical protein